MLCSQIKMAARTNVTNIKKKAQLRGGGNSNLFIRGCAILALNIAPVNPAALPKKDTHKSGKQEAHKALTTVSSMRKAGKIILRQFFSKVYP